MEAFHSFWSLPNAVRAGGRVALPDHELLTAVLSALEWQKHSGRIRMVTDTAGAEYFARAGIAEIWNEIDVRLDELDGRVDPVYFWAAGKLEALSGMPSSCAMLDTDLILWKRPELSENCEICAAHEEELLPQVYPDPLKFHLKAGYHYPESWDLSRRAANTAFLYIKDTGFRDRYVREAIRFCENICFDNLNPVTAMCFAEQRILPMCAAAEGKTVNFLLDLKNAERQDFVTHTWGFKDLLRQNRKAEEEFCLRCVRRILLDFPEKEKMLADSVSLKEYYRKYREIEKKIARRA